MTSSSTDQQPSGPERRPLRDVPTTVHPPEPPVAAPPTPSPLPVGPTEYHHFLRTPRAAWWRGLLGIIATCVLFLLLQVVVTIPVVVVQALTGWELIKMEGTNIVMTPALLVVTNVSIALMIPVSLLLQRLLFGQQGRWMHSVTGRFRWRIALRLGAALLPFWLVYALVLTLLFPEAAGAGGGAAAPTLAATLTMLAIVVLTTPFQAAGEEYAARGMLARSFGSWFASPRAALVAAFIGPNLLFMLAHGATDWTLALYYLFFGLACTVLVWRTGGLEAAVVLHAVNNATLFAVSSFFTTEMVIDRSAGNGGAVMLIPAVMIALATVAISLWARRREVVRAVDPQPVEQG